MAHVKSKLHGCGDFINVLSSRAGSSDEAKRYILVFNGYFWSNYEHVISIKGKALPRFGEGLGYFLGHRFIDNLKRVRFWA